MSILIRLDDLIGWTNSGANPSDGIFQGDHRNRCGKKSPNKIQGLLSFLFSPRNTLVPVQAATGQICAWWMKNCQVPSHTEHLKYVALKVIPWRLGGEQIA